MNATESTAVSIPRRIAAAIVAGFLVALATHVGTIALGMLGSASGFFAGTSNYLIVPELNNQFIPSSTFVLIAAIVFGYIGAFRRWWLGLAAGIVFGGASVLGGTTLLFAQNGQSVPIGPLMGTLLGFNFGFLVATALAWSLIGPAVWRRMLRPSRTQAALGRRIALVRVPADTLAEGISSTGATVDVDLANEQWDAYVSALLAHGWSTVEVEPAPTLADSVFVEDPAIVVGSRAIIALPGAASRVDEVDGVEAALVEQGLAVTRIIAPGTLEGGDVLQVGDILYVGRSARTNAEGIRQLREALADTDVTVVTVPVLAGLHLKSAVTALPDGTVVGDASAVDASVFDRFLALPDAHAAVVQLAPDTVLMAASAPASRALVEDLGYRVVAVDISEFEKLDGCVTCLSIRLV